MRWRACTYTQAFFLYFCMQGANVEAIEQIMISTQLVEFKTTLECIRDPNLHLSLRAAYLEFIIASVVERCAQEFGTEIASMLHTFVSVQHDCSVFF